MANIHNAHVKAVHHVVVLVRVLLLEFREHPQDLLVSVQELIDLESTVAQRLLLVVTDGGIHLQ